jgi:hypothetical protein
VEARLIGWREASPEEEKAHEGIGRPARLTVCRTLRTREGSKALKWGFGTVTPQGEAVSPQPQEGRGHGDEPGRLFTRETPWREKPGRASGMKQARKVTWGANRRGVEKTRGRTAAVAWKPS